MNIKETSNLTHFRWWHRRELNDNNEKQKFEINVVRLVPCEKCTCASYTRSIRLTSCLFGSLPRTHQPLSFCEQFSSRGIISYTHRFQTTIVVAVRFVWKKFSTAEKEWIVLVPFSFTNEKTYFGRSILYETHLVLILII